MVTDRLRRVRLRLRLAVLRWVVWYLQSVEVPLFPTATAGKGDSVLLTSEAAMEAVEDPKLQLPLLVRDLGIKTLQMEARLNRLLALCDAIQWVI